MKATKTLRNKVTKTVAPKVSRAVSKRLPAKVKKVSPESVLALPLAKRMADRTVATLEKLNELAEQSPTMKAARDTVGRRIPATLKGRFLDLKKGLNKAVKEPVAVRPPATKITAETDKPMPQVIRTRGGKRLPAAVAKSAVRSAPKKQKVKTGQKKK